MLTVIAQIEAKSCDLGSNNRFNDSANKCHHCNTRLSEEPAQRDKVITSRSFYNTPVTRFLKGVLKV